MVPGLQFDTHESAKWTHTCYGIIAEEHTDVLQADPAAVAIVELYAYEVRRCCSRIRSAAGRSIDDLLGVDGTSWIKASVLLTPVGAQARAYWYTLHALRSYLEDL